MKKYAPTDIHYIINAGAGKCNPGHLKEMLGKFAPGSSITITQDKEDLDKIFEEQSNTKKIYVAVGGDGTVRQLGKHVYATGDILGVMPMGSGNGLARELGMTGNIEELVNTIEQGNSQRLDILNVNGHAGVNVAGLGFDAELAWQFSRLGTRGLFGYVLAGIKTVLRFKPFQVEISCNNMKITGKYWMVAFANATQFGNNARIAPEALPNDGILDLVLVKPFTPLLFPVFLYRLFTGKLKSSRYVNYLRTKNPVTIKTSPVRLHIDGDVVEAGTVFEVKLIPDAIEVIIPKKDKQN